MAGYSSEGQVWTVQHTGKEIGGVWGSEGRLGAARVPLLLLHSWLAPSVEALAPRTRGGLDQSIKMMPMMRGRADGGVGEAVGVAALGQHVRAFQLASPRSRPTLTATHTPWWGVIGRGRSPGERTPNACPNFELNRMGGFTGPLLHSRSPTSEAAPGPSCDQWVRRRSMDFLEAEARLSPPSREGGLEGRRSDPHRRREAKLALRV